MGVGDTGGVNLMTHPEELKHCKTLYNTPSKYFESIRTKINKLSSVEGELPGFFSGVYTTHQDIKQLSRTTEDMLYQAEAVFAMAWLLGKPWSRDELERIWKSLLFNQFHDIIWGVFTPEVMENVKSDLQNAKRSLEQLILKGQLRVASTCNVKGQGIPFIVFNTLPWKRSGIIETEIETGINGYREYETLALFDGDGEEHVKICRKSFRKAQKFCKEKICVKVNDIPAMGYKLFWIRGAESVKHSRRQKLRIAENKFFRLEMNPATGAIASFIDKKTRKEWVKRGADFGMWKIYEEGCHDLDYNARHDAWYLGCTGKVEIPEKDGIPRVIDDNPDRITILTKHKYGNSFFRQEIILYNELPWIEVEVTIDWNETEKLARLEFPLEMSGNSKVKADPHFASMERPKDGTEFPARDWICMHDDNCRICALQ